jgi:hypothetical protein
MGNEGKGSTTCPRQKLGNFLLETAAYEQFNLLVQSGRRRTALTKKRLPVLE